MGQDPSRDTDSTRELLGDIDPQAMQVSDALDAIRGVDEVGEMITRRRAEIDAVLSVIRPRKPVTFRVLRRAREILGGAHEAP